MCTRIRSGTTWQCRTRSLTWVSRYPSVALSMWRAGTVDDAGWEVPDARPAVANTMWVQYLLDNFSTVADAVAAVPDVRISSVPVRGHQMGAHVAIEDSSGDSAIIEGAERRITDRLEPASLPY